MDLEPIYEGILRQYAGELAVARADALRWWNGLVGKEATTIGVDPQRAEHRCRMRWPLGPVSHPRVIAVYRKYFFEIAQINEEYILNHEEKPESDDASPEASFWNNAGQPDMLQLFISEPGALLYEGLEKIDETLFSFMTSFVFTPIGMDAEGQLK